MEEDDGTWIVTDVAVIFLYTPRHIFETSCLPYLINPYHSF